MLHLHMQSGTSTHVQAKQVCMIKYNLAPDLLSVQLYSASWTQGCMQHLLKCRSSCSVAPLLLAAQLGWLQPAGIQKVVACTLNIAETEVVAFDKTGTLTGSLMCMLARPGVRTYCWFMSTTGVDILSTSVVDTKQ